MDGEQKVVRVQVHERHHKIVEFLEPLLECLERRVYVQIGQVIARHLTFTAHSQLLGVCLVIAIANQQCNLEVDYLLSALQIYLLANHIEITGFYFGIFVWQTLANN